MVGHTDVLEVRQLLIKIVSSQSAETSEFRVAVTEASRESFESFASESD